MRSYVVRRQVYTGNDGKPVVQQKVYSNVNDDDDDFGFGQGNQLSSNFFSMNGGMEDDDDFGSFFGNKDIDSFFKGMGGQPGVKTYYYSSSTKDGKTTVKETKDGKTTVKETQESQPKKKTTTTNNKPKNNTQKITYNYEEPNEEEDDGFQELDMNQGYEDVEDGYNPNIKIKNIENIYNKYADNSKKQTNKGSTNKKGSSNFDYNSFYQEVLKRHNELRRTHQVGDMTLNNELNEIAQNYADYLAQNNMFDHSDNDYKGKPLGENLYYCSSSLCKRPSGSEVSNSWYGEIKDYDFNSGDSATGEATGHFTQLVWKASTQLGVGIGINGPTTIVVCNYYPAGNYIGQERKNVFRAKK